MDRKTTIEFIFGSILLLSNKIQIWGDELLKDITFKQWFLLIMITKMGIQNPTIREVSDFTGTSRQNVKKMLEQLEKKKYVRIIKSKTDARALNVMILRKTHDYFAEYEKKCAEAASSMFSEITDKDLSITVNTFNKLHVFLGNLTFDELKERETKE